MADALFDTIAFRQGRERWGEVLDAGTGEHSLRWLAGLPTDRWVAVTGDATRADALRSALADRMRPADRVVAGNWRDPGFLADARFDVVIADYLLGAMDGFAPYFQDRLFLRLRPHVRTTLYVVGLEPLPDVAPTPGGSAILEIARLRNAAIGLAGHRTYREYPMSWVVRNLTKSGYRVSYQQHVPIVYGNRFVDRQLDVAKRKLPFLKDPALAEVLGAHIENLRIRVRELVEAEGGIRLGSDYVVAAHPLEDP